MLCGILELYLHCSVMHGESSRSAEGSSSCHRLGVHPVSSPGVLHWAGVDPVLWLESPALSRGSQRPGVSLVSSRRNPVDVC